MYVCYPDSTKPNDNRHTIGIVAKPLDEYVWASFVEACSDERVVTSALENLENHRATEVMSQLKIRQELLDENLEQQAGLVETLTMLKQDAAKFRIVKQLDTLAVEEGRIRASLAQLEQQNAMITASRAVLHRFMQLRATTDLSSLGTQEKRRLFFDFGVRVTVYPKDKDSGRPLPSERCEFEIDVLSRPYASRSNTVATP